MLGLAIGDALGAPTQSLPPSTIAQRYGGLVDRFTVGPDDQPIAPGHPAGRVTDDTEQALLLARLLIEHGGRIDAAEWGRRLLGWEDDMHSRGSLDLLGPSSRIALAELAAGGDPTRTGRRGTTNGAAMRITPVGVTSRPGDALVERVVRASAVTHSTTLALAAAGAVAFAVSAGIDGEEYVGAARWAVSGARRTAAEGVWVAGASVSARIEAALEVPTGDPAAAAEWIGTVAGTGVAANESVPAAFAVVHAAGGDPWLAVRIGASVGGDCDTIAAMAGAVAGACSDEDFPDDAVALVLAANPELADLDAVVDALLRLRDAADGGVAPVG